MTSKHFAAISLLLLFPDTLSATVHRVKVDGSGDFPTIQAALNAAVEGDSVLVFPGTYTGPQNKNLSFAGKNLVLVSSAGRDSTIVDCEYDGRAIDFSHGESSASVLKGFTLRHGQTFTDGGLMRAVAASPTVNACVFFQSIVESDVESGGAIYFQTSSSSISDCVFDLNFVYGGGGGAIYAEGSSLTFSNVLITRNATDPGKGGGLYLKNSSGDFSSCQITQNYAEGSGGGIYSVNSPIWLAGSIVASNSSGDATGGGVFTSSLISAIGTTFASNHALSGGGLASSTWTVLHDCIFSSNFGTANDGGGVGGGALLSGDIDLFRTTFRNNLTDNNNRKGVGGALSVGPGNYQTIRECDFFGNKGWRGAAIAVQGGSPEITKSVIASNSVFSPEAQRPSTFFVGASGGATRIRSSTLANNSIPPGLEGSALHVESGALVLVDSTAVFGNAVPGASHEVRVSGGVVIGSTSILDTTLVVGPGAIGWLTPPLSADPLFCSPSTEEFSVADHVSPCLPWNNPWSVQIGAREAGCNSHCPSSGTFYVPSPAHTSIASAIAAAAPGDTVCVCAGTWREQLTMRDGVSVVGNGTASPSTILELPPEIAGGAVVVANSITTDTSFRGVAVNGTPGASVGLSCEAGTTGLRVASSSFTGHLVGISADPTSAPVIGGSLVDANDIHGNSVRNVIASSPDCIDATFNYWGTLNYSAILETVVGAVRLCPIADSTHTETYCGAVDAPPSQTRSSEPLRVVAKPNPFRTSTEIAWNQPGLLGGEVTIFDVAGRRMRSFKDVAMGVTWDGTNDRGRTVPAGVYYYRFQVGRDVASGRLIRIK